LFIVEKRRTGKKMKIQNDLLARRLLGKVHSAVTPLTIEYSFLSGQNASLNCQLGSVPGSRVHWFYQDLQQRREILNNSVSNRGEQRFIVYNQNGGGRGGRTSTLVLTNVMEEDSGKFICVVENRAGKAEANFTLQVSKLKVKAIVNSGLECLHLIA
jgi:hypothetical protein